MDRKFSLTLGVLRHSRTQPDALAVASDERTLTYAQLARSAASLAAHLRNSPGWPAAGGPEPPRVAILASRSVEACIALLGASWAGATYVPLGQDLPEERLLAILSQCNVAAIVADAQGARLLSRKVLEAGPAAVFILGEEGSRAQGRVTWLGPDSLAAMADPEPSPLGAMDTAYIIFTSGTTGVPKGVMVAAGAVRHYIETITPLLGLRPSDRALETCELTFDFSVHNMFTTWEAGASLHLLAATRAMNAVRFAREHAITVWNSTPSLIGRLQQLKALRPLYLAGVRLAVFGGEPLCKATVEAWNAAAPDSGVYNLYGPTEATVFCLAQRIEQPLALSPGRDVLAIGQPLPGTQAAVLDRSGLPVPDGTPGELAVSGIQLAKGYLNAPELTAARFPTLGGKRCYLTGDLALRDGRGTFHCLGRIDNQVKVRGHRVELEEIDAHLRLAADTGLAASVAWPVVDGAPQGIVGFVAGSAVDADSIISGLKRRLPRYMVPSRIVPVQAMPTNASGKVDRQALRRLLG
jgi:amino acid adenylation domain-containing protein